jgi:hypothetical protein
MRALPSTVMLGYGGVRPTTHSEACPVRAMSRAFARRRSVEMNTASASSTK